MLYKLFIFLLLISFIIASNDILNIENFSHNFCESRLQNDNPPELFNAYTSFFITILPVFLGFPKNDNYLHIAYSLFLNGIGSYYYHYNLNWLGKQLDEVSMILANYFGINALLQTERIDMNNYIFYLMNFTFMYLFIVINTLPYFDFLFPYIFGVYLIPTLYFIRKISNNYEENYLFYLGISLIGAICWFLSEKFCNRYTVFGHVVWHLLFPLGFYLIVVRYDKIYSRLNMV